jgi:UDP-N-acetylglucosamine 2-epimerase (non-hydrolysing)
MPKKILIVFGTRPEAIKMCPLILPLEDSFTVKTCVTSQHREMLDQVLDLFDVNPDYDLDIMKPNQDLFDITSNVLLGIKEVLKIEKPDMVLVHGDTTTTMAASLASFYLEIPVSHVEAGLRTNDIYSPFPEEFNRQVTSKLANLHFAPTEKSKTNLIDERINEKNIFITGNTVIDALLSTTKKSKKIDYPEEILNTLPFLNETGDSQRIILVTGHRRENFGKGMEDVCNAIKEISIANRNLKIIYLVHLNPNVVEPVNRILGDIDNIYLIEPVDYLNFIKLMDDSYLILTDSGGIQEEAPSLGKPVLVTRETTERPEAIDAGTVKLVGTDKALIVSETQKILNNQSIYDQMSRAHNPYGDGLSSKRIADILIKELS